METIWHAVFQSKLSPLLLWYKKLFCEPHCLHWKDQGKEKKKWRSKSSSKVSFQLKISVTFWTRRRALCEESPKTLFSPLLLGVCCSVETFYEIITMVLITPWSADCEVNTQKEHILFSSCNIYCAAGFKVFLKELRDEIAWHNCLRC